jgi:CHAT domain-containing protein
VSPNPNSYPYIPCIGLGLIGRLELNVITVSIDEIDKEISHLMETLSSSSPSNPLHPALLSALAMLRSQRYVLSDDERDLDTSILLSTYAILLPSFFSTVKKDGPNPISTFYSLTILFFLRSHSASQPNDVESCLRYLRYLRDQSLEAFGVIRNDVTASLVDVLAFPQDTELGNAMQGVEEMSTLCHELLASGLSETELIIPVESFARAVVVHTMGSGLQLSQQVIECLRDANTRLPDSHDILFALSRSLVPRFYTTKSNHNYDVTMAPLDKIIASYSPADTPSYYVGHALNLAAGLAKARFYIFGDPKYREEAIFRFRTYLGSLSPEDPKRGPTVHTLVELEGSRFDKSGVKKGLPELDSDDPEVINFPGPSFSHLATSISQLNSDESPSMTVDDLIQHMHILKSMNRITDKAEIKEGVKYCRLLLASLDSLQTIPDDKLNLTHLTLTRSGEFLLHAFEITNNPEYLNESIGICHGILRMPHVEWIQYLVISRLITSLISRFMIFNDSKDYDEIMKQYPIAVTDTYARVSDRLQVACQWAQIARTSGHSFTSTAYNSAISLLQDALTFSPTLETQHSHLVTMRDDYEKLPLDYASYQVHIGQLEEATETLERGRGLLWSEMRGLRTSIDQLRRENSHLAGKFAAVNRDLEALATSNPLSHLINDAEVDFSDGMDPFGHTVVKQRNLLDERNGLITQIRSLPGFENFLMAPSFDALRSAAACGPVIIINHSEWRSDILILLHDSPPSVITTTDDFYHRAIELSDRLLNTRKQHRLESKQYQHALRYVLQGLYELVGRPVIEELRRLKIPEQSRVWWCPTSVFCSFPLHAIGPIPSSDNVTRYFLDLYIPSYTPSLSALIESRKSTRQSLEKPSLLLVAQPDEYLLQAWPEIWHVQRLGTKVTTLISKRAIPSAVVEGLRDHRFAHFVCHGILEPGKPFDASFQLYKDKRLTLLDIVRSQLTTAEFAFLSACHTAEITDGSVADEALHLTAAVQYCGFRSVVGTMWAMADMDGKGLVEDFYKSTFSEDESQASVPFHERTAKALRDAVKKLRRKKGVPLERWVNFVHYGA